MTEFELGSLESEIGRLRTEINELERKAAHPADNDRLHLFRPQAQQVTNRKKDLMQRVQLLKEELTVLNRTEQILRSRATNLEEALKKMEVERGIQGYRNQQDDIQKVSE